MAPKYTKNRIREVFIEMLNEHSLNKITVEAIAKECQINRNTFYYYYHDIYELLSEIFEEELSHVMDEYNETLSWEESFLLATRFALDNRRAIYHVYNSMKREELENYIYEAAGNTMTMHIEDLSSDIKASESDKELIANFYQSALTQMILRWIGEGMKGDANKVIRRIGKLFDGNIELSLKRSQELNIDL
ncbi:MAG: TetR/AcrR family transcriptional regulator C-terminal domain-containing protein [Peptoniphilaceae bacterium]